MALKIGFARKYYTVWDYSVSYRTDARGVNYKTEHYVFLRNASMNKEKALAKYPDAEFCEDLRGRTRSWDYEQRIVEYNKFHVGKYSGQLFATCHDYNYMMWFYNNCATVDQQAHIELILVPEGYEVEEHRYKSENGDYYNVTKQMISPEDVKSIKEQREREAAIKNRLTDGTPLVVTFTKNLDGNGEYYDPNFSLVIKFTEFAPHYYQGFEYAFPKDAKGHAKRVKNKQLLIEKYELLEDDNTYNTIIVNEWRFA